MLEKIQVEELQAAAKCLALRWREELTIRRLVAAGFKDGNGYVINNKFVDRFVKPKLGTAYRVHLRAWLDDWELEVWGGPFKVSHNSRVTVRIPKDATVATKSGNRRMDYVLFKIVASIQYDHLLKAIQDLLPYTQYEVAAEKAMAWNALVARLGDASDLFPSFLSAFTRDGQRARDYSFGWSDLEYWDGDKRIAELCEAADKLTGGDWK